MRAYVTFSALFFSLTHENYAELVFVFIDHKIVSIDAHKFEEKTIELEIPIGAIGQKLFYHCKRAYRIIRKPNECERM